ncbi:MAG: bifunctional hydroxymethylpyrimidine kinase/phosphomethylpyrimidine kinase [Acidobacteria bacterium]|nr:bifunctional hydroxymethylpyrimidine kinase/phosphomethylpyrimidine kinase [Acidobacteriota bacterium]
MLVVLSIAGFDPSGGAGILADIKTFAAFDCFGVAAITSLTSQNTMGVYAVNHQSADILRMQINPILNDFNIAAVKIGMLPSQETVEIGAETIECYKLTNVVIDPVIRSSSGYELIDKTAMKLFINRLLPLADVVTPNLIEAEQMTNLEVKDLNGMRLAAKAIYEMAHLGSSKYKQPAPRRTVLIKGGHLPGDDATDILFDGSEFHSFRTSKIATRNTHGTGCTLSSAIAALLARGFNIPQAVAGAKRYLEAALRSAPDIGRGAGPVNHTVRNFEI